MQSVIVANPKTNPVQVADVLAPGSNAVRYSAVLLNTASDDTVVPSVPAGKRLVVTYVTVNAISADGVNGPGNTVCYLDLNTSSSHDRLGGLPASSIGVTAVAGEQMFLPLESGEGLGVFCQGSTGIAMNDHVTVAGYYVPA